MPPAAGRVVRLPQTRSRPELPPCWRSDGKARRARARRPRGCLPFPFRHSRADETVFARDPECLSCASAGRVFASWRDFYRHVSVRSMRELADWRRAHAALVPAIYNAQAKAIENLYQEHLLRSENNDIVRSISMAGNQSLRTSGREPCRTGSSDPLDGQHAHLSRGGPDRRLDRHGVNMPALNRSVGSSRAGASSFSYFIPSGHS